MATRRSAASSADAGAAPPRDRAGRSARGGAARGAGRAGGAGWQEWGRGHSPPLLIRSHQAKSRCLAAARSDTTTILPVPQAWGGGSGARSEEHTSELQSLMRISYAVFCLKNKKTEEQ